MQTDNNELHIRVLAASAATKEEVEAARKRTDDGSKPVTTEKRPYRPKPASRYEEPEYLPDDDDTLEVLYRNGGVAISKLIDDIGERDKESIIIFDEQRDGKHWKNHCNGTTAPKHSDQQYSS